MTSPAHAHDTDPSEPLTITAPGVYDIPAEDYHRDPVPGGSLSSTGARKLLPPSCPAKFRYEQDNPPTPTAALDFGQAPGLDPVDLGQRHGAAFDAEQVEDVQMLPRLRHHAVVRGHDQQGKVDPGRAGKHGVDETLMTGYVDETQHPAAGQGLVGVTQFDGNSAQLLGGEPVGVDAGERMHQRRLAVIDVPGRTDDHDGAVISLEVMR